MSRTRSAPFAAAGVASLFRGQDDDGQAGFTLIEVMVALLIFGMIALAGVAILSFSIRAQAATGAKLDDNAALNRTFSALSADCAQAVDRATRDERGTTLPAFAGEAGSTMAPMLRLVRGGWSNVDGAARPSEQKVAWTLDGHVLERVVWPQLDGTAPLVAAPMLAHVKAVALRYRFRGAWSDRWDGATGVALPQAIEWRIVRDDGTEYRQMLIVGAGYVPGPPRAG